MLNSRWIGVLAAVLFVTNGCTYLGHQGQQSSSVPVKISHRDIGADTYATLRLPADRDVFIEITDANTLIYDYALDSREVVIDVAAREAIRGLLLASGGDALAPPDGGSVVAALASPRDREGRLFTESSFETITALSAFQAFADSVFRASTDLVSFVRYSDETEDPNEVNRERAKVLDTLEIREYLDSEGLLEARAESLWRPLVAGERTRLLPRKTALATIIPKIFTLHKAIQRATFGSLWVQRSTSASETAMVELTISSKLGSDYPGVRWTGKGKDIALVRASFPWIAWTVGMSGVLRSDRAFHLQSSVADSGKFLVRKSSDSRLGMMPVGMLTLQGPCCRTSAIGGISLGMGLRSGGVKLDDGTDLLLMGTLGLDWLRISLGGAYTAEVYDLTEIQPGDLVDSPNALNSQKTKRRLRPAIAVHMAF